MGTPVNANPEDSAGACYFAADNITVEDRRNRQVLASALEDVGLVNYPTEWSHWSYGDRYWALLTDQLAALYGPMPSIGSVAKRRLGEPRGSGLSSPGVGEDAAVPEMLYRREQFEVVELSRLPPPLAMSHCNPWDAARSLTRMEYADRNREPSGEELGEVFLFGVYPDHGRGLCRSHAHP